MVQSILRILKQEGIFGFILLMTACSIVWAVFLGYFWGMGFIPHICADDDCMHKTVIYFMLHGQDFYSAWRNAATACGDLSDLRIYRTPLVFYAIVGLTGWAGDNFVFPLSVICVMVAASNLVLSFWTARQMLNSGWAGLAASFTQLAFFYNLIPRFQISLFAMPFLITAVYFAWKENVWVAGCTSALAFLIKESFAFALPAFIVFSLLQRKKKETAIYAGIYLLAAISYLVHVWIAQPVFDPTMLLATSLPMLAMNFMGFVWYGFILLYYNTLIPVTIGGFYPFSPIPPFLPYPAFLAGLVIQVGLVWIPIGYLTITGFQKRTLPDMKLLLVGLVMWLVPLIISATTIITSFSIWWIQFAVWRWFAPSYVGFQLIVAISWHMIYSRLQNRYRPSAANASTEQAYE